MKKALKFLLQDAQELEKIAPGIVERVNLVISLAEEGVKKSILMPLIFNLELKMNSLRGC